MSSSTSSSVESRISSSAYAPVSWEFDGEPVYCKCPARSPMWTTRKAGRNFGRRFFSCPNYKVKTCGFFKWHDEPFSERACWLIDYLKKENEDLRREANRYREQEFVIVDLKCEISTMEEELKIEIEKGKKLRRKNMVLCMVIVISWVFLLIVTGKRNAI